MCRTLWNPSSSNAQGQIKLWVDILTPEEGKPSLIQYLSSQLNPNLRKTSAPQYPPSTSYV
jgi:hypothetical protein